MCDNWPLVLFVLIIILALVMPSNESYIHYGPRDWYDPDYRYNLHQTGPMIPREITVSPAKGVSSRGKWYPWGVYSRW